MPTTKRRSRAAPRSFYPVPRYDEEVFVGYTIYVNETPFLQMASPKVPLKRHDAYAICRLLNAATSSRKWAARYPDPYVEAST